MIQLFQKLFEINVRSLKKKIQNQRKTVLEANDVLGAADSTNFSSE